MEFIISYTQTHTDTHTHIYIYIYIYIYVTNYGVRGSFTTEAQRSKITPDYQKLYQLYFVCPLGDQDRNEHLMSCVRRVQMDMVTG